MGEAQRLRSLEDENRRLNSWYPILAWTRGAEGDRTNLREAIYFREIFVRELTRSREQRPFCCRFCNARI